MASTVIPIWPGSSSFAQVYNNYYINGNWPPPTPFGFYDNDPQFQSDANKVANFCALRLGYPIENVELQDINFWSIRLSYNFIWNLSNFIFTFFICSSHKTLN